MIFGYPSWAAPDAGETSGAGGGAGTRWPSPTATAASKACVASGVVPPFLRGFLMR